MNKNRWNNDLQQYLREEYYTKAEIDAKFGGTGGFNTTTVIVTYSDSSTETIDLLRRG